MSVLEITEAGPLKLPLADIRVDPELQCRAHGLSAAVVRDYAALMKAGTVFPAVTIFRDNRGVNWLADGFHRVAAAELAGGTEIAVDVRDGSRKDAQLFAVGANDSHGLRRSTACKRKAVSMLLADPTWSKRSDNWIAERAKVSQPFVSKMRATSNVISDGPRETADGRVMDTSKIGTRNGDDSGSKLEQFAIKFRRIWSAVSDQDRDQFADQIRAILIEHREQV